MTHRRPARALGWALGLLLAPLAVLLIVGAPGWVDRSVVQRTLGGLLIATAGGVPTGLAAERLLHRGRSTFANLAGVVVTSTLGVLTIGYLYLVHIQGPMQSIGTLDRAVIQILSFVGYLTAMGAGMLIAPVLLGGGEDRQD